MKSVQVIVLPIIVMCLKKYKAAKIFEKQMDIREKTSYEHAKFSKFCFDGSEAIQNLHISGCC